MRIRHERHLADRVPAGTHRGDGDQARSRASQTMEDMSESELGRRRRNGQAGNGRAALKLRRLGGARRAHRAASDARVTKAVSSICICSVLMSSGASARMPVVARPRWQVVVVSEW